MNQLSNQWKILLKSVGLFWLLKVLSSYGIVDFRFRISFIFHIWFEIRNGIISFEISSTNRDQRK